MLLFVLRVHLVKDLAVLLLQRLKDGGGFEIGDDQQGSPGIQFTRLLGAIHISIGLQKMGVKRPNTNRSIY